MLTVENQTRPISYWAGEYGIPVNLIRSRLRRGWSEERAVTEPMIVRSGEKLPADAMIDADPSPASPATQTTMAQKEAALDRSATRRFTFDGQTLTLSQWAAKLNVQVATLQQRIRQGWPLNRALTLPCRCKGNRKQSTFKGKMLEHDGKTMSVKDWAAHLHIDAQVIYHRLRKGHPIDVVIYAPPRKGRRLRQETAR